MPKLLMTLFFLITRALPKTHQHCCCQFTGSLPEFKVAQRNLLGIFQAEMFMFYFPSMSTLSCFIAEMSLNKAPRTERDGENFSEVQLGCA